MDNISNNLVLELHVPDFQKAREFYSNFGFRELSYDKLVMGSLGYLVLQREDLLGRTIINFYGDTERVANHPRFADFPKDTPRGYAVEITIPVSDIDILWNEVKDKINVRQISQPLEMKEWGKKDFRVVDPFGFYLRFTESVDWGQ